MELWLIAYITIITALFGLWWYYDDESKTPRYSIALKKQFILRRNVCVIIMILITIGCLVWKIMTKNQNKIKPRPTSSSEASNVTSSGPVIPLPPRVPRKKDTPPDPTLDPILDPTPLTRPVATKDQTSNYQAAAAIHKRFIDLKIIANTENRFKQEQREHQMSDLRDDCQNEYPNEYDNFDWTI